jgi:hypothetical protein
MPPPRRYEIVIDGRKTVVSIKQTAAPSQRTPQEITMRTKRFAEIQGATLREDELMEHASNDSERGLIVDAAGQIHRPDEIATTLGQPFFPPTYVGEQVVSLPGGNVITRRRLRALVASGRLKRPANLVNSFRSDRIRRRHRPFDPKLAMQAAALSNPGAYHGLAISPKAALVGRSAAFLGYAVATGRAKIGADGSVYVRSRDESGASVFKKIGRVAKKGTKLAKKGVRTVGKGAKAAGRGIGKGAVATGKGVAKGAKFVGKGAAMLASAPIKAILKPHARKKAALIARSKGHPTPTTQDRREGGAWVVANMLKNRNPLVKAAALLVRAGGGVMGQISVTVGGDGRIFVGAAPAAAAVPAMLAAIKVSLIPILSAMLANEAKKMLQNKISPSPSPAAPPLAERPHRVAPPEAPGAVPEDIEMPGTDEGEIPGEGELEPEADAVEGWSFLTFSERLSR